jgi:hypothetical protein
LFPHELFILKSPLPTGIGQPQVLHHIARVERGCSSTVEIDSVMENGDDAVLDNDMVSNCAFGFALSINDKYRFNTTFNCFTPFSGGIALTDDNN